jgi:hypothetical protein
MRNRSVGDSTATKWGLDAASTFWRELGLRFGSSAGEGHRSASRANLDAGSSRLRGAAGSSSQKVAVGTAWKWTCRNRDERGSYDMAFELDSEPCGRRAGTF